MVISKINGGLGNQLFQYAVGKQLAIKNNTKLKLDISEFKKYKLRNFELIHLLPKLEIASNFDIPISGHTFGKKLQKLNWLFEKLSYISVKNEKFFHFDPDVLEYKRNIYLSGYWQSDKYFNNIKSELQNEISLNDAIFETHIDIINEIEYSNSISLHIRRGDYIKNPVNQRIYASCSLKYYDDAIAYMSNKVDNPVFFVFSDDLEWVKRNLNIPFHHTFISDNHAWEDLRLMSFCKHNIIANSTFSWWGAYLGTYKNKFVIAPKEWFVDIKAYNTKDLIPKAWIKL
jgi:hypothetical protein